MNFIIPKPQQKSLKSILLSNILDRFDKHIGSDMKYFAIKYALFNIFPLVLV